MSNCPRRTIGWSSCPVIRSQRRICCSCFDSCRSNFLLNRRQESKPGTIAKSRERSSPVVPTFGAASQGFQYLGVTHPPQLVKSGYRGGHKSMPGGRLSPSGAGYADQPATSEVTALPPATHVDAPHHHRGPWRRHVAAVARGRQPGSV